MKEKVNRGLEDEDGEIFQKVKQKKGKKTTDIHLKWVNFMVCKLSFTKAI